MWVFDRRNIYAVLPAIFCAKTKGSTGLRNLTSSLPVSSGGSDMIIEGLVS